jgi:hypothetical protein
VETVYRDYAPKGVQFYYVYKRLAHPEFNGYIDPHTLEERLMHVREAGRSLGSEITWLADTMASDLKHALGDHPNPEFVVDPDGVIIAARQWSDPDALREDLENAVGAVDNPTRVEDLDMPATPPTEIAPSGVVPRLQRPDRMRAVVVAPAPSDDVHYAKLRAEATSSLLEDGSGDLYLGFFVDPIHRVHWNNLVAPIEFGISAPEGVTVTPNHGVGPEVEAASDVDPREFLVSVTGADADTALDITVRYFGCSDEQGWCRAITQNYSVRLSADLDAGRAMTGRRGGPPNGFLFSRPNPEADAVVDLIFVADENGDDRLTRDEAPYRLRQSFESIDANGDGHIDREEARAHVDEATPSAP